MFHPYAQKPSVDGYVPIWFRGSSRERNQLCVIVLQSAHGFWFCDGSKFAISIDLASRR